MAKRIVFTETGEVRQPRKGEWFVEGPFGTPTLACEDWTTWSCRILTRTEETITDPPKPRQVVWVPCDLDSIDCHDIRGAYYRRVEVPTKAEMIAHATERSVTEANAFMGGVLWLADKLGIKLE